MHTLQHLAVVQDILALGAIFATTDSVAVLQVLNKDRSPILFSLVFGEGVINDAAGVALLRAIQVRSFADLLRKYSVCAMSPSDCTPTLPTLTHCNHLGFVSMLQVLVIVVGC